MLFNTPAFLIFFPLTVLAAFLLPKKLQNPLLLAASLVFYGFADARLVLLLLFVSLSSWLCACGMERFPARKKLLAGLGVSCPLLLLFFFKYLGFFLRGLLLFLPQADLSFADRIVLPVGISFYTFQAVSYILDVKRGEMPAEKDALLLALYLSFFPQLVAGPIERAKDLLPQLRKPRDFDPDGAVGGLKLMLAGFFEKIAVADMLGLFVNRIWKDPGAASGPEAVLAALLFSLQILCDFRGYSLIARGAAGVLGIRLSVNFDRPYASASLGEFWRRWHITLSSWLRDYVYIPLGGSRGTAFLRARNLLLVFLVSGLWHGAGLNFLIWGLLHGLVMVLESLTERSAPGGKLRRLRQGLCFTFVTLAWIPFRAPDLTAAGTFLTRFITGWSTGITAAGTRELICAGAALASFAASSFLLPRLAGGGKGKAVLRHIGYTLMLWLTLAAYLVLRSEGIQSSVIYVRF
ncbi:MAG: MBOAT family protein [Lachnospiraceae bacterium]|nr:MBOAT family protein [Lachnospiraceae bacterium]